MGGFVKASGPGRVQAVPVGRLRQGEQVRFENGESSVFLLNAREASLVTARLKLAELQAKYAQTQALLRWAAGGVE